MTTAPSSERKTGLAVMAFARKQTLAFLESIQQPQALHQPFPGANHATWIAGHIVWEEDFWITKLKPRASVLSATYTDLFGTASTPMADVSAYPTLDQLREKLLQVREEMVAWVNGMSEEQLHAPLPKELAGFAETAILMSALSWHEGLHAGQLTVIRKSLGMKPKFM